MLNPPLSGRKAAEPEKAAEIEPMSWDWAFELGHKKIDFLFNHTLCEIYIFNMNAIF